jgi:uncharacterized SAM-binding protein YcdF (DUF218 family)
MNRKAKILLAALILAALWLAGLFSFVRDTEAMAPPEALTRADAVVVLTGGSNRIEAGFRLLNDGKGGKLFISGVQRGVEVKALLKLARQESSAKVDCCVVLGGAENTVENARETAEWLRHENFRSFYLVTANYHMKRALLEFENAVPGLEIIPYPVSPDRLDMKVWWRDDALRILIVREYSKYLLERARYAL